MTRRKQNAGFTLIELSIVLVVIGLIIGSVLVVNNIILNARVTSAINAWQAVQAAVASYNQNYNALPGDDAQAKQRFSNNGVTHSGGGNGVIGAATLTSTFEAKNITAADGDGAAESGMVWGHLRAAGLIKGTGGDDTPPGNPFGGVIGVQNGAFAATDFDVGTNVRCLSNVPGAAAIILDQRLDDGDATTGTIRGGTSITAATAAYVEGTSYVLCTAL